MKQTVHGANGFRKGMGRQHARHKGTLALAAHESWRAGDPGPGLGAERWPGEGRMFRWACWGQSCWGISRCTCTSGLGSLSPATLGANPVPAPYGYKAEFNHRQTRYRGAAALAYRGITGPQDRQAGCRSGFCLVCASVTGRGRSASASPVLRIRLSRPGVRGDRMPVLLVRGKMVWFSQLCGAVGKLERMGALSNNVGSV